MASISSPSSCHSDQSDTPEGRRAAERTHRQAPLRAIVARSTATPGALTAQGAHCVSHRPAVPAGAGRRPALLRTPSSRADLPVPPVEAARSELHRSHRGQHRRRAAPASIAWEASPRLAATVVHSLSEGAAHRGTAVAGAGGTCARSGAPVVSTVNGSGLTCIAPSGGARPEGQPAWVHVRTGALHV